MNNDLQRQNTILFLFRTSQCDMCDDISANDGNVSAQAVKQHIIDTSLTHPTTLASPGVDIDTILQRPHQKIK